MSGQTRNVETIIAGMAADIGRQAADNFMEQFDNLSYDLEKWSPIERLMGFGLLFALEHRGHFMGNGGCNDFSISGAVSSFDELSTDWPEGHMHYGIKIIPQLKVGPYFSDFFICLKAWRGKTVLGIIECDGHDFHERTKSQAAHDKRRDRFFQSKGLIVLRYTGSEIFRAPVDCASSALKIFTDLSLAK